MNRTCCLRLASVLVAGSLFTATAADLKLNAFFGDHAVLQCERPVPVWGTAEPGAAVNVVFAGQEKTAVADASGTWRVTFDPLSAAKTPRTLAVTSGEKRTEVSDVLVGEVWLAAGQSNMTLPIWGSSPLFRDTHGLLAIRTQRHEDIRYVKVDPEKPGWSPEPARQPQPLPWHRFVPEEVIAPKDPTVIRHRPLSAIAFYYALELHHALDVPVAVVDATIGGTSIEAWISAQGFASRPDLADVANDRVYGMREWKKEYAHGVIRSGHDQRSVLWNGMVADFAPYAIRGVIWYQGCSNVAEPERYAAKMHALYNGLSYAFARRDLPFLFVQLTLMKGENRYPLQLEQARFAAEEPNAAMVVTADAQEQHTLHPLKKSLIARRLAAFAMDRCYGAGNPQADAARPVACRSEGNRLTVEFANARAFYSVGSVIGLELAGRDGVFKPAKIATPIAFSPTGDAFRDGNRLTFEANGVDSPIRVRYLCKDTGYGSNLYSDDAMPVGPFEIALPETDAASSN